MGDEALPEDVLRFIVERVDSVPHLEALLLLWGSFERPWTASEIAARVYVSENVARQLLQDLAQRKLVRVTSAEAQQYVYDPTWDGSAGMMPRLAATYRTHLVPVAKIIHSKAPPGIDAFARAFRFKKDD